MIRAITYINDQFDERQPLNEPGVTAGLGRRRFCAAFRPRTGVSPRRYICRQRLRKPRALRAGGESPASAARVVDFYDQSYLCRNFNNTFDMTTGQCISGPRGAKAAAACNREREAV